MSISSRNRAYSDFSEVEKGLCLLSFSSFEKQPIHVKKEKGGGM
jgi:hypothetical protein